MKMKNAQAAKRYGPLSRWLEPVAPAAGIHLSARFRRDTLPGIGEDDVIAAAADASVGLYGLSRFYRNREGERGLLFGYGGMSTQAIDDALVRVARVFETLAQRTPALT